MVVGAELLRLIDSIHRDKGINKEILFESIENALLTASRKRWGPHGDLTVRINRITGELEAYEDGKRIDPAEFGRISAQTAKQIMIQKIREAERDVIFDDYEKRIDSLVTGTVQRFEKGNIIASLGRAEGLVPKSEQIFSEQYRPGDRIRAFLVKVQKKGQKVIIILSRTHPNLVKELFGLEVPEIGDRIVEIKGIVREPGHRTKIAVYSSDPKVDAIGACVGVRGTRIRNIVEELGGEKIDIVRFSDSPDLFIRNALSPAEISAVELDRESQHARVIVPEDQLSLAIGKKGQNVRLTAKLTHWHIDIMTEEQARKLRELERAEIYKITCIPENITEKMLLGGITSLKQILARTADHFQTIYDLSPEQAQALLEYAAQRDKEMEEERAKIQQAPARRPAAAAAPAAPPAESAPAAETPAPADQAQTEAAAPGAGGTA
ncbi:MAG: transcription termination/antitermination protein NusA [Planctomycetes bacterium]|nr:transcription termination/antitermination protein NusA [Planctomycetota bacterium]